jgi:hypothetical protein
MKRLPAMAALLCFGAVLGGCAAYRSVFPGPAAPAPAPVAAAQPAPGDGIQRVPFRTGVSSATVEKLARQQACTGGQGAGLVTEQGPVEVYRMTCDSGKVFMARCELRQCRAM